ncbi:MAG: hypothetical protein AUH88_03935 [Acidobacteria bacterium 13_1_40CM_4_61_5]|nr:MAG: hypothetical protein AUH88_03935 [Acidobacteria bacterium 13_1_40CM_4_61_5]
MNRTLDSMFKIWPEMAGAALLFLVASVPARGQSAPPPPPGQETTAQQSPSGAQSGAPVAVIKKESRLVLVDAVVMDKKGNYVHDLKQPDFRVFEDNKEQSVTSFSTGAEMAVATKAQRHYMILFFDNSTMAFGDQAHAREAAGKFIDANAGPDRLMAIVDFGGTLRITQNFTANADRLKRAAGAVKNSSVDPNAPPPTEVAAIGAPPLGSRAAGNSQPCKKPPGCARTENGDLVFVGVSADR